MRIILDSNFVVIPFMFKVDIYSELDRLIDESYELYILNCQIKEIEKLKNGKAALELAKRKGVKIEKMFVPGGVDNSILAFAKENDAVIATQDKELKRKAKEAGLRVITMRQKKYLDFA